MFRYYTFNGQRVALRGTTGLVYLHTDHLGSTKLVTDRDGNPVQPATQYTAYGREQSPGSVAGLPTDYAFTGQRIALRQGDKLAYSNYCMDG